MSKTSFRQQSLSMDFDEISRLASLKNTEHQCLLLLDIQLSSSIFFQEVKAFREEALQEESRKHYIQAMIEVIFVVSVFQFLIDLFKPVIEPSSPCAAPRGVAWNLICIVCTIQCAIQNHFQADAQCVSEKKIPLNIF